MEDIKPHQRNETLLPFVVDSRQLRVGGVTVLKSLTPAKRHTLGDEVAERLRDAILLGEFVAGQRLREESLAEMLQVSRGPVRDALGVLEREGLVVLTPHHGATVVELSREDLEEVYSLRMVLEILAARYAVRSATAADLNRLEDALANFIDALAGEPTEQEAADLDVQFHDAFYQAAHHDRLYLSWSNIRLQVYRFLLSRNLANPDWRDNMARGHTDILEILRSRDEEALVAVVGDHIQFAHRRILESFVPRDPAEELLQVTGAVAEPAEKPSRPRARSRQSR